MTSEQPKIYVPPIESLLSTNVNFRLSEIDVAINRLGYLVEHSRALKCPCRSPGNGSQLSTCKNCGGTGWVFINPTETKMIMHSMGANVKQLAWSMEQVGNANVTALSDLDLSYMDRLVVKEAKVSMSQLLFGLPLDGQLLGFAHYPIKQVSELFLFVDAEKTLLKLNLGADFTVDRHVVRFNDEFLKLDNPTFSIRYTHAPCFHVLDLTREIMLSPVLDDDSIPAASRFPVSAVARRAHLLLAMENYQGNRLLDNSYHAC